MTTRQYHPTIDSVPYKAIAQMRELGRGMKAREIADHTGYENKNVGNILQSAVTHGVLLKIGKGLSTYWCLPEHAGPEFVPPGNPTDADVEQAQGAPVDGYPLQIAVWHDGDVVVHGGTAVDWHDGEPAVSFNRAQIAQLVRMLARPTVAVAA